MPGGYARRAPRLWIFPSGARKVSQVQVASDSGSPSKRAPLLTAWAQIPDLGSGIDARGEKLVMAAWGQRR